MKTSNHSNGKPNLYQVVTNQILELLEGQKLTWNKPWVSVQGKRAHNAATKRTYSGLNQIVLSLRQTYLVVPYNGWLTFAQIQALGGRVISGESSSAIYYYKILYFDRDGNQVSSDQVQALSDSELKKRDLRKRFVLRHYNVFNIAQTTNLPSSFYKIEESPPYTWVQKDDKAESLVQSTKAKIIHWASDEACYNYVNDVIFLPEREQFEGLTAYYETTLHELAHWTGHASRLNRKLQNAFRTNDYAKEELIAELCSAFLCAELGFSMGITNNAAYIQSWIEVLKEDPRYIFNAAHKAEEAATLINSFSRTPVEAKDQDSDL
jgi:antirestriction protein ArdC